MHENKLPKTVRLLNTLNLRVAGKFVHCIQRVLWYLDWFILTTILCIQVPNKGVRRTIVLSKCKYVIQTIKYRTLPTSTFSKGCGIRPCWSIDCRLCHPSSLGDGHFKRIQFTAGTFQFRFGC